MRSRLGILLLLLATALGGALMAPSSANAAASLTLSVDTGAPVSQPASYASVASGARSYVLATGQLRPARPGRTVYVYRKSGSHLYYAGRGVQNRYGVYRAYVAAPSTTTYYRARYGSIGSRYARVIPRTTVFADYFNTLDSSKWVPRVQGPTGPLRYCSEVPSANRVLITRGLARLGVTRYTTNTTGPSGHTCPRGQFYGTMISNEGTSTTLPAYGTFAARVRFPHYQGMHGAFWLQGDSEIDAAEFFGDGRPDGGLTSYVHQNGHKVGGARAYSSILGSGHTPGNGFHIYSVQWSPAGYIFRVDGVRTLTTTGLRSSSPAVMILSLLASDYEIPRMRTTNQFMYVDWVRVWR